MTEHADVSNPRLYREDAWAPHFERLRREDPVHRHAESPYGPYWSVTRFADIMKVELDPGTYSSASELGGIQIATHAIGDQGNHDVAAWYEEALRSLPKSEWKLADPRWRIEHAQILRPADYHYFNDLPIIASMQPSHAIGDLHFAAARLGDARLDGAYAWKSLTDRDVIVVGGSDAPVERGDPLIEFYAAVARRDLNGFQGPDWRPQEAVSRETALKMFTLWPAYASFREDELGTIEVGKRADFTAFSVDLMTAPAADILNGLALYTIVDGVVVHRATAPMQVSPAI